MNQSRRRVGLFVVGTLVLASWACSIEGKGSRPVDNFSGDWNQCIKYYLEKGWAGNEQNARNWCQTGNNGFEQR